jgi:hypothetical protein
MRVGQSSNQLEERNLVCNVDVRRRLVEEQQFGLLRECSSEDNALSLTAREFIELPQCELRGIGDAERFLGHIEIRLRVKAQRTDACVSSGEYVFERAQRKAHLTSL